MCEGHGVRARSRVACIHIPQLFTTSSCSQYLGSKGKHVRESTVFADTASTRSISRFCTTADTFGLALMRDTLLLVLPCIPFVVLRVSRGVVLRVLQVLAVFRPLAVFVRTASAPKYSQYAQYTWSMKYFGNMYREYSHYYLEAPYRGYCLHSQVFRVSILWIHICLCSRGSVLLILSLLSVFGSSQYSQHFGRQFSNTLSTNCSRDPFFSVLATFWPPLLLSVLGLRIVREIYL